MSIVSRPGLSRLKPEYWMALVLSIIIPVLLMMISRYYYLLLLIPFFILFLVGFAKDIRSFLYVIAFVSPLSVLLSEFIPSGSFDLYIPSEPLIVIFFLLFIISRGRHEYDSTAVFSHPVTLIILFNLLWLLVTSVTSTLPVVSFKFFLSRLLYVAVFYFVGLLVFRDDRAIKRFAWMFIAGLSAVIIYTLYKLYAYGLFNRNAAHFVMQPFFKDHTSYGAMIAMFFPFLTGMIFIRQNLYLRIFAGILTLLFLIALVYSYSRAAWLSLIVAAIAILIIRLRIRTSVVVLAVLIFIFFVGISFNTLFMQMERNRQGTDEDLAKHLQSVSNVTTDASNRERINRWKCAIAMFQEKPLFGWGPGTYMFQYAPFQHSADLTPISTNAGILGSAHSEYLGPLAESGLPGFLSMIILMAAVIYFGIKNFRQARQPESKIIVLAVLAGLITYGTHGLLNNFLDTDKASVAFWSFIAIITTARNDKQPNKCG